MDSTPARLIRPLCGADAVPDNERSAPIHLAHRKESMMYPSIPT